MSVETLCSPKAVEQSAEDGDWLVFTDIHYSHVKILMNADLWRGLGELVDEHREAESGASVPDDSGARYFVAGSPQTGWSVFDRDTCRNAAFERSDVQLTFGDRVDAVAVALSLNSPGEIPMPIR